MTLVYHDFCYKSKNFAWVYMQGLWHSLRTFISITFNQIPNILELDDKKVFLQNIHCQAYSDSYYFSNDTNKTLETQTFAQVWNQRR